MEAERPDPRADDLADLLAACDDALARGDSKSSLDAIRSADDRERPILMIVRIESIRVKAIPGGAEALSQSLPTFHADLIQRQRGRAAQL